MDCCHHQMPFLFLSKVIGTLNPCLIRVYSVCFKQYGVQASATTLSPGGSFSRAVGRN